MLGELPSKLKQDLLLRTAYILDTNSENFDGSFIQATALNPQLAVLLDDAQTSYAKAAIEKLVSFVITGPKSLPWLLALPLYFFLPDEGCKNTS